MPVLQQHDAALVHHVNQGQAWLELSEQGQMAVPLSYSAFEFRYAIERLAVEYWKTLLCRPLTEGDLESLTTYKRLERRLYDLAGHQRQIDGHFAFMRAVCEVAKIPSQLPTPNLGRLSEHWHACSEVCHIVWPLTSGLAPFREATFKKLAQVLDTLRPLVKSQLVGWPVIHDAEFAKLRDRFVQGKATTADVHAYAQERGLWAQVVDKDEKHQHFIGEAIAPRTASSHDE